MKKIFQISDAALVLHHVLAMFVGNLTPLLIITGACCLASTDFADLQLCLLQNAMLIAGVITLVQLFAIGPIGGKVPIIMGTSSGFLGVFNSVAATMGGGVLAYGAIMGASIIGGIFETFLGFFLKPLRKFFPSVVTGTVVMSIGLSLISVGINSFGGGNKAADFGSMENILLAFFVLAVIFFFIKHAPVWVLPIVTANIINDITSGSPERIFKFFLDSGRNYCRLCCSIHHGFGASSHGHCSGRNRIYQSMGIKLG